MRRSLLFAIALFSLFACDQMVQAAQSLQDQYLQIYLLIQEADKLETDGQKAAAYKRYQTALSRLEALPKDWEPGIVNYRIHFCKDKLTSLQDSVNQDSGGDTVSNHTGNVAPPSAEDTVKIKQYISQLEGELNRTKKDLASAVADSQDLQQKLSVAERNLEQARANDLTERVSELMAENKALREQMAQSQDEAKNKNLDQKVADLLQQLSALKDQLAQSNADKMNQQQISEARYKALDQKITTLTQENDGLKNQLAQSEQDKIALKTAREHETDQRIADLLQQNDTLKNDLAKAEDTIKNLQSGPSETSVASLQAQLQKVEGELKLQQQANAAFEQTTADLKAQLEEAKTNLALSQQKVLANPNAESFQRENDILRGIIVREMQEQARHDAAKKLAQDELNNLKVKSQVLQQQIDILSSPIVNLSDDERALLRQPTAQVYPANNVLKVQLAQNSSGPETPSGSTSIITTTTSAGAATGNNGTDNPVVDYRSKPRVPEEMRPIAQEANNLFAQKKYDEAALLYQRIIDRYPDSLYAWSNLGVVRFQQQNYVEAQKALLQAVRLSPSDGFSYSILGIVYYQLGKYDDAISTLTKAAALDPNDAKTLNYLGISCSQKGLQEAAEQQLRKAIEIDPTYGDAHFNLAVIYATQKPPAKELARRHYKEALDLGIPKDPQLDKLLLQ